MSLTKEAESALMYVLQWGYVNEWHDGEILVGDKEPIGLPVFLELLEKDYVDMSAGNHLYSTYRPTNKAKVHTFIV